MKTLLILIASLMAPLVIFSQARININTGYIALNHGSSTHPIYLVVDNKAANAISSYSTTGWLISEGEFNYVKWYINKGTGTYVLPFGYSTSDFLPLTLSIGTKGDTSVGQQGSVNFSTWHTVADNWTGVTSVSGPPSDVTNMASMNAGGRPSNSDNSYNTVDRFWVIEADNYSTKPAPNGITFTYIRSGAQSEIATPNTSGMEANFIAQRFNNTVGIDTWGDWLGAGPWTPNGNVGTVANSTTVSPANFFRSWTLSNSINPLPIELSSFNDECDNGVALIHWTTQSELNNDYFTVERTNDNIHFETVGNNIPGAGTTSLPSNYKIFDNNPLPETSYYVLYQTDMDGTRTQIGSPITFTNCSANSNYINAFNTTNYIDVMVTSGDNEPYTITLKSILGQTLLTQMHQPQPGMNEIKINNQNLSPGIYILNIYSGEIEYSKKIVIGVH